MNVRMLALASMVLALGLTSCGNDESEEEVNNTQELCFYSYDDNSTELGFTSYKTTAKVPVKLDFTQKESVIDFAFAVPHNKSETFNPSIF